jgi:hypothetical protein
MIYCSVDEAYDTHNSGKPHKQMPIRLSDKYFTAQGELDDEPYTNGSSDKDKITTSEGTSLEKLKNHSFFTAQGDLSENKEVNNYPKTNYVSNPYSDDIDFYDDLSIKSKQINHNYCIKKFVDNIVYDDDLRTLDSYDDEIYDHLKSCKYCRSQINIKLKERMIYNNTKNDETKIIAKTEHFSLESYGYDLKEITIIILAGILLIFILDLLVKLGKKT